MKLLDQRRALCDTSIQYKCEMKLKGRIFGKFYANPGLRLKPI